MLKWSPFQWLIVTITSDSYSSLLRNSIWSKAVAWPARLGVMVRLCVCHSRNQSTRQSFFVSAGFPPKNEQPGCVKSSISPFLLTHNIYLPVHASMCDVKATNNRASRCAWLTLMGTSIQTFQQNLRRALKPSGPRRTPIESDWLLHCDCTAIRCCSQRLLVDHCTKSIRAC